MHGIRRNTGRDYTFEDLAAFTLSTANEKLSLDKDLFTAELFASFFQPHTPLKRIEGNELEIIKFIKQRQAGEIVVCYKFDPAKGKFISSKPRRPKPSSRTTTNRALAWLRHAFYVGMERGMCAKQPVKRGMVNGRAEQEAMRREFLSPAEIERYLQACSERYYPLALTLTETGMRLSEALGLTWDRVNFTANTILLVHTKSGRSRTVQLTSRLAETLRNLKATSKDNIVFKGPLDKRYANIRYQHNDALQRSGLEAERAAEGKPHLRIHDLRHSFGTNLTAACKDLTVTQRALGHRCYTTTLRYSHVTEERYAQAVEQASKQQLSEGNVRIFTIPRNSTTQETPQGAQGETIETFPNQAAIW